MTVRLKVNQAELSLLGRAIELARAGGGIPALARILAAAFVAQATELELSDEDAARLQVACILLGAQGEKKAAKLERRLLASRTAARLAE